MPGLVGIIGKIEKSDKKLFRKMYESVVYEKWYKIDKHTGGNHAFASVHLNVINQKPQPIFNEKKNLCILMYGEVFGYENEMEKLKSKGHKFVVGNDSEFCLHMYEEYGENFLKKLNGSFVIAIIDTKNKKTLVANDRYGLRPLYYARNNDKILIASEVKAVTKDKAIKREINDDAVAEFFTFGCILGNKTFFKKISMLPPASILIHQNENFKIKQYWYFKHKENAKNYSEEYFVNNLIKLFKNAVERNMKGINKPGVFLSGGLDSRAVLAAINKKHYPITTITFTFDGSDKISETIKIISEKLGTTAKIFKLKTDFLVDFGEKFVYITDGMISLVHAHNISLLDKFRCTINIGLSGWEPETTFKGTFLNKEVLFAKNDRELCNILYRKSNVGVNERLASQFFSDQYYRKVRGLPYKNMERELNKIKDKNMANKSDCFLFLNREQRLFIMPEVCNRTKIENRLPFRDNDLVNFALKIPIELRYNSTIYLKFLKNLMPELSKINFITKSKNIKINRPRIIKNIFLIKNYSIKKIKLVLNKLTFSQINLQNKSDYPNYGEWARKNKRLRKWVEEILLDERTLSRKYFNRDFIVKMVKDHMNYKKDYTQLIFLLLTFELWYRTFIEG